MIRLSEANYNSSGTFKLYKETGLYRYNKPKNLILPDRITDLSKLSELTGMTLNQLEELTFSPYLRSESPEGLEKMKFQFEHFGTSGYRSKICPQCLKENGYLRKNWDITFITTCHIHKCKLHDSCPLCKRILSPYRKRINHCDCGYDLRDLSVQICVNTQVEELLDYKLFESSEKKLIPSYIIENLSFLESVYLILYFTGVISSKFFNEKRLKYSKSVNESNLANLSHIAVVIFQEWPLNFYCFLDALRISNHRNSSNRSEGLSGFDRFHHLIFEKLDIPAFKNILDEFINYLSKFWSVGYCGNRDLSDSNKNLLDHLQIKLDSIEQVLKLDHGINHSIKRKIAYQNKEDVILDPEDTLISIKTVMKDLDISYDLAYSFRERGVIQAVRGPGIDGNKKWLFSSKAINKLINQLNHKVIQLSDNERSLIGVTQVKKIFAAFSYTYSDLIEAIINNEIQPFSLNENSRLKEFKFERKEIIKYLKKGNLMVEDISEEMGVDKKCIYSWIEKGFLGSSSVNKVVLLISKVDYLIFKKTYMTVAEALNKQSKVKSVESLVKFFRTKGIAPVSGPKVDGGKGYLFRRDGRINYWLHQLRRSKQEK